MSVLCKMRIVAAILRIATAITANVAELERSDNLAAFDVPV